MADFMISSGLFLLVAAKFSSAPRRRPELGATPVNRAKSQRRLWLESWRGVGRQRLFLLGLLGEDVAMDVKRRPDPDRIFKMIRARRRFVIDVGVKARDFTERPRTRTIA